MSYKKINMLAITFQADENDTFFNCCTLLTAIEKLLNIVLGGVRSAQFVSSFSGRSNTAMLLILYFISFALLHGHFYTNAQDIYFKPSAITLAMDESFTITYEITNVSQQGKTHDFLVYSEDKNVATLDTEQLILKPLENLNDSFMVNGIFLGKTVISCLDKSTNETMKTNVEVTVIRKERIIDTIFTVSVAALVSLIYVNFGCAMNWGDLKGILRKPIGPVLGFFGQFIFMPLLSYGLGKLLFPENPAMQLGMFFTGTSPGGGASNLWTLLLEGNISLSIAMSAVSTITAFGMIPLWIFTLGRTIFESANLDVPYTQIMGYVVALIVPLGVGYLIQRYLKNIAHCLVRMMKMVSLCLLLFIIMFAIVTNLWLFDLFSWKIIVAGMAVPWIGYLAGFFISKLLKQPGPDCTAIAIEIGIQNTGIAIFLLRFSLPQPEADLTTIVPVSIAILTPLPLLLLFIYKKIQARCFGSRSQAHGKSDTDVHSVVTLKL